ncbi:glycosyltransferase family 9 protein [Naasia aerilata]|uniref:Glycosyl transferase n=1 Tax=Naasia aerilata TaxID=1162966 RepID=A0ABM8G805_9MICO|nr:glycosyltransferase family 9 protein [Naasia aerilata]BDZ44308.1 glycosyl transferase [Naasia aerilata]
MKLLAEPDGRPELLALRTLKLGDLLVAVPALHALRRTFPEHRLILAMPGWLDPIIDLVHGVDALLPTRGLDDPLAVDADRIDIAVNLHGVGGESCERLEEIRPRRRIGHRSPGWDGPEWLDGIHERHRWARLVTEHGMPADENEVWLDDPGPSANPGAAVVHVGAFYGSRHWPLDRFAAVAQALERRGLRAVVTGGAADRDRALRVAELAGLPEDRVLAGRMDLREMAATVAAAAIVVTVDTGAAHLASAYARPSVVLFGPSPPEEWGPPPGRHVVLTDARLRVGDTFGSDPDPALLAVNADDVVAAADGLLG